jgi:hypothetical protein
MKQRLGLNQGAPIDADFPQPARRALGYALNRLRENHAINP